MVKSILQANTIELHYWMDDNSHIIDANIQNKCERELLDILDSIAGQWGLSVIYAKIYINYVMYRE